MTSARVSEPELFLNTLNFMKAIALPTLEPLAAGAVRGNREDAFRTLGGCLTHRLSWMLLLLTLVLPHGLRAEITEPHNLVWGSITLGTNAVTASQTNIVVQARRSLTSPPIATYRMGQNSAARNFYSLAIPLESVTPARDESATRSGEQLLLMVLNGNSVRYLTLFTVGSRGKIVRLDMGDIDSDNNGLVDNWERQYFGAAGQDPNGDPDRDGVSNRNEMLSGTNPTVPDSKHPADTNPTNNVISIGEVTAYALAWKTGKPWHVAPTNIPVEFVARAGFLWKNGEKYALDTNNLAAGAPLWWTNTVTPAVAGAGLTTPSGNGRALAKNALASNTLPDAPFEGSVIRSLSALPEQVGSAATGALHVMLDVQTPKSTSVYVVEEVLPEGWAPSQISDEGVFDPASRRIRWGMFFDGDRRSLSYQVVPGVPSAAESIVGLASFDGRNLGIAGPDRWSIGPTLAQPSSPVSIHNGGLSVKLLGESGKSYEVQVSTNLLEWTRLGVVTAGQDGQLEFSESAQLPMGQRFYRARRIEE